LPEAHRGGPVEQDVETQVLLVHEQLQVEAVEAPVDVPVDVANVVADPVRPVVGELDADALARALPLALHAPAERRPRDEAQALELREKIRRQQILPGANGGRHAVTSRPATGSTPSPASGSRAAPALARWTPPSSSGTGRARPGTASSTPCS